jgi:CarD family transcriptional regulator
MPQNKKTASKSAKQTTAKVHVASKLTAKTAKVVSKLGKSAPKHASVKSKPSKQTIKTPLTAKSVQKPAAKLLKAAVKKAIVLPTAKKAAPGKAPAPAKAPAKIIVAKAAPAKAPAAKVAPAKVAPVKLPPQATVAAAPKSVSVPAAVAKQAAQRISSPPIEAKDQSPATKAADAHRQQQLAAAAAAAKKPVNARHGFKTNEFIVYPAHGVGRIVGIEEQEIAGMALELFVITFEKDKMTLRVPTGKLQSVGMRKLADEAIVKRAMETLKGRARIKRTMWSRRAQEYEAKINSGDLISIAEVVRDLYRSETQPEQSYSERQLYEAALDRMAREIAAVDKLDERGAVQRITDVLSKSAKGRRAAEEDAAAEVEDEAGDDEVQAA